MLNAIWAGMIVLGILYGAFTGNLEAVSNAALESAGWIYVLRCAGSWDFGQV